MLYVAVFLFLLDMAETVSLTKYVHSDELRHLFVDFKVEIPEDPSKLSFAKRFLQASNFSEFVAEIKSIASKVVLHKKLRTEDKKPGTVYVYEVVVRKVEDELLIEEKVIYVFLSCMNLRYTVIILIPF